MEKVAVLLTYVNVCGAVKEKMGVRPLLSQTCTQDRPCPLCCNVRYVCQSGLCQHSSQPIPKILHHVNMGNREDLWKVEGTPGRQPGVRFPAHNRTIHRSRPQRLHDWQYMF